MEDICHKECKNIKFTYMYIFLRPFNFPMSDSQFNSTLKLILYAYIPMGNVPKWRRDQTHMRKVVIIRLQSKFFMN